MPSSVLATVMSLMLILIGLVVVIPLVIVGIAVLGFKVSGWALAYWILIGIDPRPKPLAYWARFVLLLLALAVHGFFAVALMMGTSPLAAEWYGVVQPPWIGDALHDTLNGGQVAWGLSEIPSLIVLIVIAVQWARSDDREATRRDRQAERDDDAELRAYNERLAALAAREHTPERAYPPAIKEGVADFVR